MRLEKFLLQEQNHLWKKPQKKCNLHSQRCEVCELLSRNISNKENKLLQATWDAVTAKEVRPGKFIVTHQYQYRHDPLQAYEPRKSNLVEPMGHAKKVIKRAHRQGSLHLLNQVEKMIKKNCFQEVSREELMKLSEISHNFCFYNWVHLQALRSG